MTWGLWLLGWPLGAIYSSQPEAMATFIARAAAGAVER